MLTLAGRFQNPYSSFEHIVFSVCFSGAKEWRFVMSDALTVYVDDSGTDGKSRIAAAAFCVSTVDKWLHFEDAWRKIADRAGFELKHWHMTEFAACRPGHLCQQCKHGETSAAEHPWQKWTKQKRENVLKRMAKALVETVEFGLGIAHTKEDYEKYVRDSPARALANEPVGDEHFTFAVQQCGGKLAIWRAAENRQSAPLKFVFDTSSKKQKREIAHVFLAAANERSKYDGGIEQWFDDVGVAYKSRKSVPQLLSADMLAWTIATIRSREIFRSGRFVEMFQLGYVFTGEKARHINIGYTAEEPFIEWEKRILGSAVDEKSTETPSHQAGEVDN
jgi:hypothetical protein